MSSGDTEPDAAERAAPGAALADPDDPILLPDDEWRLLRKLTRLAGPMPGDDPVTRAVLAERERIAVVAEDLGAHYHGADGRSAPFADYLRGQSATQTPQQGATP